VFSNNKVIMQTTLVLPNLLIVVLPWKHEEKSDDKIISQ
jgi:hypothetical protein